MAERGVLEQGLPLRRALVASAAHALCPHLFGQAELLLKVCVSMPVWMDFLGLGTSGLESRVSQVVPVLATSDHVLGVVFDLDREQQIMQRL